MKVLIINFNRLTLPVNMANFIYNAGHEPIFIDNKSTYKPLLEYYKKTPYEVIRLGYNYGHMIVWQTDLIEQLGIKENYAVTDPDLDLSLVPGDFIEVMNKGLRDYPNAIKCGLSLEIDDLPNTDSGNLVRSIESQYWTPFGDYYNAPIDTTMAVYRPDYDVSLHLVGFSLRTKRPYTARHVPWYYENFKDLPEDEQYYFNTANGSSSGKDRIKR